MGNGHQNTILPRRPDIPLSNENTTAGWRAAEEAGTDRTLTARREVIGRRLFDRATGLFALQRTVTPYDPANTYFEGGAAAEGPARTLQGQAHRTAIHNALGIDPAPDGTRRTVVRIGPKHTGCNAT